MLLSVVIFEHCEDSNIVPGNCIGVSLIPLIFPLICGALKVLCLKSQRMLLWGGFVVCLLAQIILLSIVNVQFKQKVGSQSYGAISPGLEVWLVFVPAMIFGLLVDLEILI